MAVITRMDSRSRKNNSLQVQDLEGNILCTIEVVPSQKDNGSAFEANLRIQTSDSIKIVKGNGAVLRKK